MEMSTKYSVVSQTIALLVLFNLRYNNMDTVQYTWCLQFIKNNTLIAERKISATVQNITQYIQYNARSSHYFLQRTYLSAGVYHLRGMTCASSYAWFGLSRDLSE